MRNMSRNNLQLILETESKVEAWARLLIEENSESPKNPRRNKVDENQRLLTKNGKKMKRSSRGMVTRMIITTILLYMNEKVLETSHEDWVKK